MKRLGHVALMTRDKGAMLAFYRDFLGMRVVYDNTHSTMVRLTDSEYDCGIVLIEAEDAPEAALCRYQHFGFNVADREEMATYLARAKAFGIGVEGPFEDDYIGYYAFMRDPDGNGVELSTPEGVNRF